SRGRGRQPAARTMVGCAALADVTSDEALPDDRRAGARARERHAQRSAGGFDSRRGPGDILSPRYADFRKVEARGSASPITRCALGLVPGLRLGPYEILSALGAGGMGEVYRARDTRLDRIVALKILPAALAGDPQFRERFDREARAISQLDHPNICALF